MAPRIMVADIGNSRLKWAVVEGTGRFQSLSAVHLDEPAWDLAWKEQGLGTEAARWWIASVNPPVTAKFRSFLESMGTAPSQWLLSAQDVPVPHELAEPGATGADRALAVLAATSVQPKGRPLLIVSCGTAVTVERVSAEGVWQGGAISLGLALAARALYEGTAQLPAVPIPLEPPPWGSATLTALSAGIFWGIVGGIRELVARQSDEWRDPPSIVWTGGDAERLAPWVVGSGATIVPDLVLRGLAILATKHDVP